MKEIIIANTALEAIAPSIATAIMGELFVVPKNYYYIISDQPFIISKSVGNLVEFLSQNFTVRQAKTVSVTSLL